MATLPMPDDAGGGEVPDPGRSGGPDFRLAHQVAWSLLSDDRQRYRQVAVSAQNRVVILTGVASADAREQAGQIARHSAGVTDVCNMIRAASDDAADHPDTGEVGDAASGSEDELTERQRFHDIVNGLTKDASRWDSELPGPRSTRMLALVALTTAIVWSVLLVATVQFGWPVVLLVPVAVILLLTIPRLRHSSPRRG